MYYCNTKYVIMVYYHLLLMDTTGHTFHPTPKYTLIDPSQKVLFIRPVKIFKLYCGANKFFFIKIIGTILFCMLATRNDSSGLYGGPSV